MLLRLVTRIPRGWWNDSDFISVNCLSGWRSSCFAWTRRCPCMGVDESSVEKQPISTGPWSLQGSCAFLCHSSSLGRKGNCPQGNWQRCQGKVWREGWAQWLHGLRDDQKHTVYRMPFYKKHSWSWQPSGGMSVCDTWIRLHPECKPALGPRHLCWCGTGHRMILRELCQLQWSHDFHRPRTFYRLNRIPSCMVFLLLFWLGKETKAQRAKHAPGPSDGKCQVLDSTPAAWLWSPHSQPWPCLLVRILPQREKPCVATMNRRPSSVPFLVFLWKPEGRDGRFFLSPPIQTLLSNNLRGKKSWKIFPPAN